jgi:ferrous iron transport protein B
VNIHLALAGNPNSGKTTLFNRLTGTRQTTGNWPGVTVEKKVGVIRRGPNLFTLVDLPGIYSLSPYSIEEIVTRNYILEDLPDVIVNIVDASNLERNLYLTLQLKKLGRPMIVALNMMDEIEQRGDLLHLERLEALLGMPVVPVSAKLNRGILELIDAVRTLAISLGHRDGDHHHILSERPFGNETVPLDQIGHGQTGRGHERGPTGRERGLTGRERGPVSQPPHPAIHPAASPIHPKGKGKPHQPFNQPSGPGHRQHPPHGPGHGLGSGHGPGAGLGQGAGLGRALQAEHDHTREQPETLARLPLDFKPETDEETQALYQEAARITRQVLEHRRHPSDLTRSDRIDQVLTHRIWALPIFLAILFLVFQLTFHENLGGRLTGWLDVFFSESLSGWVRAGLELAGASPWIISLVVEGIIAGVGGVLTFLPQIALLFMFLSVLEDTGYMARAAFMVDKLFLKFGLSGRSFIPMLMGFGCTVPAIMAARSLENQRDRRLTIMITPFMSCGARMPIYAFFAAIFFPTHKGLVTFSMYVLGVIVAILSAVVLSKTVLRGSEAPFIIELPPYRLPDTKSLFLHIWDKVQDFIIRAGTLIFAMSVVIWIFRTFTLTFSVATDSSQSIFGLLGSLIAPLLSPLGFGNWQSSVALLTGLIAKEAVVASLGILFTPEQIALTFTPLAAYAFMTFTLLYTPCVAALGALAREMQSWRWTLAAILYQIGVAYLISLLVYQGGRLVGLAA